MAVGSKGQKKRKREINQNRQGNLVRKGVQRKQFELYPTLDDPLAGDLVDRLSKKSQIIDFLLQIKEREFLEGDKYRYLRNQLNDLLSKCNEATVDQNRRYAQMLEERARRKA